MKQQKAYRNVQVITSAQLRDRFAYIASQAVQAQGMSPTDNENLLDLVDDMDNALQEVIEIINRVRREEAE